MFIWSNSWQTKNVADALSELQLLRLALCVLRAYYSICDLLQSKICFTCNLRPAFCILYRSDLRIRSALLSRYEFAYLNTSATSSLRHKLAHISIVALQSRSSVGILNRDLCRNISAHRTRRKKIKAFLYIIQYE